jgi:hypothetical protein
VSSNRHLAKIAALLEKWEDFAGKVEDKGDKGDPETAARGQAGHPGSAVNEICQLQRWEPKELLSELREKRENFAGSSEAIGGVYRPFADFLGFPHCLLLPKAVNVINLALMFLRNAGPCLFLESVHSNPIQEIRIT